MNESNSDLQRDTLGRSPLLTFPSGGGGKLSQTPPFSNNSLGFLGGYFGRMAAHSYPEHFSVLQLYVSCVGCG